ncbi:MAG: hypothetical protein ACK55B_02480 [Cyanobacteriota bacterium]
MARSSAPKKAQEPWSRFERRVALELLSQDFSYDAAVKALERQSLVYGISDQPPYIDAARAPGPSMSCSSALLESIRSVLCRFERLPEDFSELSSEVGRVRPLAENSSFDPDGEFQKEHQPISTKRGASGFKFSRTHEKKASPRGRHELDPRVFSSLDIARLTSRDDSSIRRLAIEASEKFFFPAPLKNISKVYLVGKGLRQGGRKCGWEFQLELGYFANH